MAQIARRGGLYGDSAAVRALRGAARVAGGVRRAEARLNDAPRVDAVRLGLTLVGAAVPVDQGRHRRARPGGDRVRARRNVSSVAAAARGGAWCAATRLAALAGSAAAGGARD